jgi:hypothetical protein
MHRAEQDIFNPFTDFKNFTLSLTKFSRFIHIPERSVKPHPLQMLHIKPAAPAGFFLPGI